MSNKALCYLILLVLVVCFNGAYAVDRIWLGTVDNTWSGINWWDGSSQVGPPTSTTDGAILNANSPQVVIDAADNVVAGTILTQAGLDLDVYGMINALRMWNEYTGVVGSSTVNVYNGASVTFSGMVPESELFIGKAGTGVMNVYGGASVTTDLLRLGFDGSSSGLLNMTGGTASCNTNLISAWSSGCSGELLLSNDANVSVGNIFYTHGYGNSHVLLEDISVLYTTILWTGFGDGKTDIDIWGGKLIVGSALAYQGGTFNIDIQNTGQLIVPFDQQSTLQAWISAGNIVAYGTAGTLFLEQTGQGIVVTASLFSNPFPQDQSSSQPKNAILSWSCPFDLQSGSQHVYIGIESDNLVFVGQTLQGICTYDPNLDWGVRYFWQVVYEDSAGNFEQSPIWNFKVASDPICENQLLADLTKDCRVDFMDFEIFVTQWLVSN